MKESDKKKICELAGEGYHVSEKGVILNYDNYSVNECEMISLLVRAMWAINKITPIEIINYKDSININFTDERFSDTDIEFKFKDGEQKALEQAIVYCIQRMD
jgi:hypothetical protein